MLIVEASGRPKVSVPDEKVVLKLMKLKIQTTDPTENNESARVGRIRVSIMAPKYFEFRHQLGH
jgi:hypothetical protein